MIVTATIFVSNKEITAYDKALAVMKDSVKVESISTHWNNNDWDIETNTIIGWNMTIMAKDGANLVYFGIEVQKQLNSTPNP